MSLDGAYDEENVFAKIIRGDLPCVKVYEDEQVISFMDLFPQAEGHFLVVPKEPARNLLELSEAAAQDLIVKVKRLADAARRALRPDGLTIMQFNGEAGGQTVFHIHVHVIPRKAGASLAGHGAGKKADPEALEALAAQIRAAL